MARIEEGETLHEGFEVLASGLGVLEGPVVCQDGSIVVTSIDYGVLFRIKDGEARVLAETGGGPNGATEGPDGLIYVSQNGGAWPARNEKPSSAGVQVIDASGAVELFGLGMTAPNDLCFGPDGYLYVTDPTRKPERDDGRIWRCDVKTRECVPILECDWYPNGIGFSDEDDFIYVADSRHRRIVRMPLANPRPDRVQTVVEIDHGIPDGFAFDVESNLLVACPTFEGERGDVQVYRAEKLVGLLRPGDSKLYLNLALGPQGELYLCDSDRGEVLTRQWEHDGLPLHPFR